MAKICRVVSGGVRNNIMEALRTDSMFAGDINKDFARRAKALGLRVLNFIENLPIVWHVGLVSVLFGLHRFMCNRWNLNPWWVPVAYLSRSSLQALPPWIGLSLRRFKSA
jgi:hypothetical protein